MCERELLMVNIKRKKGSETAILFILISVFLLISSVHYHSRFPLPKKEREE